MTVRISARSLVNAIAEECGVLEQQLAQVTSTQVSPAADALQAATRERERIQGEIENLDAAVTNPLSHPLTRTTAAWSAWWMKGGWYETWIVNFPDPPAADPDDFNYISFITAREFVELLAKHSGAWDKAWEEGRQAGHRERDRDLLRMDRVESPPLARGAAADNSTR
jgi:hypothetical protein